MRFWEGSSGPGLIGNWQSRGVAAYASVSRGECCRQAEGEHAKSGVGAINDPDQHQYRCAGARKQSADKRCPVEGGHTPDHTWNKRRTPAASGPGTIIQSSEP